MTFTCEASLLGGVSWTPPGLLLAASNAALVTFVVYSLGVFVLAWLSNRIFSGKSFLSEYFLGSRSLGVWAFALTFAATSASGGSFTGFPALDLLPRMGAGPVDRQLHGGADLRDGIAGQATQSSRRQVQRDYRARCIARSLREPAARYAVGVVDRLLHGLQPRRTIQGRQRDPASAAGGCADLSSRCRLVAGPDW